MGVIKVYAYEAWTLIKVPGTFNVATHFVDPHLQEGRRAEVAIECGDERVTYQQLLERTNRAGNILLALGVRPEERVLLLLLDTPEFLYSFFGAIKIGAVAVPVNTQAKPQDYEYILNDCRARVALVERAFLGGDCLNVGCVPSKALIRASRAAAEGACCAISSSKVLFGSSREARK